MKKKMFFGLFLIMGGITNCVSIQDLINENALPAIEDGVLDLENRGITSFEGTENIPGHENIREVYLGFNKLTIIPIKIKGFENVEKLFLRDNEIRKMPGRWGGIRRTPSTIEGLENLKFLDLSKNKLIGMTEEIEGLENLQRLRLDDNMITTIPNNIQRLPNLQRLDLENNPIQPKNIGGITISAQKQIEQLQKNMNALRSANQPRLIIAY